MKLMQRIGSRFICVLMYAATSVCNSPTQAQDCEPHWSDEFPSGDLGVGPNRVLAITEFKDGSGHGAEVYISGFFTEGSGQTLNHIAKLDNSNNGWAPLGEGADGNIYAMTVFDDGQTSGEALYAAGSFSTIDSIAANNIAKWNGTTWTPLDKGLNGSVRSLYSFNDGTDLALYAGGHINEADGTHMGIARWDGKTWTSVGGGVNGDVRAMIEFDDGSGPSLFVGGSFTTAGGIPVNNIARWDGEHWLPLGDGVDPAIVYSLAIFDDGTGPALYVGGSFDDAGGVPANNIAKWNGESWSTLGTGTDSSVSSLAAFDDGFGSALYAGGFFENAGGVSVRGIAKWDGKQWMAMGPEFNYNSHVLALTVVDDPQQDGTILCVGGSFSSANFLPLRNFAKWNGANWSGAGAGLNSSSISVTFDLAIIEKGGDVLPGLYAGGVITVAGGTPVAGITHWDGHEWEPVGEVINTQYIEVRDLAVVDMGTGPMLYAAGAFVKIGGQDANCIAKWNGQTWSPLSTGLSYVAICLASSEDYDDGPALFAGGWFLDAGETTVNHIARWDGTLWSPLGAGMNDRVLALTIFDDGSGNGLELYAGGVFTTAGKVNANHIAKWDGLQWSPLGEGVNGSVSALTAYDDGTGNGLALYAGGNFSIAGKTEVQSLARWDGQQWSAITDYKSQILPNIITLQVLDDNLTNNSALYIGGYFESIGGIKANSIARWDGQTWSTFGIGFEYVNSNFDPYVVGMKIFDDGSRDGPTLFAVGQFNFAGGNSSQNIAKWVICNKAILGDLDGDGAVGTSDLLILFANWGQCTDCNNCEADLDDNCTVGTSDLLILFSNWG